MNRNDADTIQLWDDFHGLVNMPSPVLRDWLLDTPGGVDAYAPDPDLDVRELGEQTLEILGKRQVDITDRDTETMAQVVDSIRQLLENPPESEADRAPWRDSLMTLGHDPLRTEESPDIGAAP